MQRSLGSLSIVQRTNDGIEYVTADRDVATPTHTPGRDRDGDLASSASSLIGTDTSVGDDGAAGDPGSASAAAEAAETEAV